MLSHMFQPISLISLLLCGCASMSLDERPLVEYGCGDLVLIGRAETLSYTDLSGPEDALSHGLYEMDISIRKVLRGKVDSRRLRASRAAHGQLRSDLDFVFVLHLDWDEWRLDKAHLASSKPLVATNCT
ncbi:hypothetical protein CKY28_00300 [Sphingomonas lenta]|uniref:Uncharacterized protein n=1 Tax=Sphingomonas lenta TaxID=1141887 RepID=A0A2A2SIZ6_9SPHN|nr:hypothetical protein CKY28_00300 [Sphingomonas lenta]